MVKILFRTSGGRNTKKELGLGHIYRCINLTNHLKSHEIQFLIEDYGSVFKLLHENGFKKIVKLHVNLSEIDDLKKTSNYILKNNIDLLIIDKYGYSNHYVKTLKKIVKTVMISDLRNISFDSDLLINGFIGYDNSVIFNKFKTKCFLGPKYQILNKEYEKSYNYKKKYDLLITLGGFDANNLLELILKKIYKIDKKLKIKIILGPATIKIPNIKKFEKSSIHIDLIKKTKSLKKDISNSKFGVCGGGITSYEFASLQVPFAIVCQYPHQIITAREWEKKKIAKNLGFIQKNEAKIDLFLEQLFNDQINLKMSKIIDGLGSKRVAKEIQKILKN